MPDTRRSVLIVEDDALIASDLSRQLLESGLHVVGVASSYDEAIELCTAAAPHVACIDIRIRGNADGIALARELRAQGTCIVMITASPDLLTPEFARHVVVKPFHPQSVIAEIDAALRSQQNSRQDREHANARAEARKS